MFHLERAGVIVLQTSLVFLVMQRQYYYSHYMEKSEKFLEKNFVCGQISNFLLECLLNSRDIMKLKI